MNYAANNYNNNRRINEIFKSISLAGQKCFIIGGGESLKDFDFSILDGQKVITINVGFVRCPNSFINYSMDSPLYKQILNGELNKKHPNIDKFWYEYKGQRIFLSPMEPKDFGKEVLLVMRNPIKEVSFDFDSGIYGESNAGFGAINLAVLLGCKEIYLLGYDMKCTNSSHWHGGYDNRDLKKFNSRLQDNFKVAIEQFVPLWKEKGINIYNCNPDSELKCFPFININEVLK